MKNTDIKSILAADCGNATTTTVLIERVNGAYRLQAAGQAPSTHGPPWEDITVGIQEAAHHIEKVVERTLLTPAGWPITPQNIARQGVDAFVVVSSAGPPLRVMLAGLIENISLASARRAVATTYTHITHIISLDAEGNIQQHSPEAGIQAIQEKKPEAILLAGGTDGGAEFPVIEMVRVISMAMQILQDGEKPNILYAGNSKMRTHVADMLGPLAPLKSVSNVRPTLDIEDLAATQMELENLYVQRKMSRLPGFDKLSNWSEYPITPASKSFEKVIAYIGRHNNLNVLGVDIGSRSTMASSQTQQQLNSTIRSDAGIGHSLAALLDIVPIEQFHRWLPFELYPEELYNRLLTKSLYPTSIPTSYEDLMIEHAVAREALKLVVNQLRRNAPENQWNLIIGAGRVLTGTPQPAQAVMVMIDGVEPSGVTSLALDRSGVVNMLGSIAAVAPMAAVEVAAQDVFLNLGTIVAPLGHGQPDKPALKFKIEYAAEESIEKEVPYGAIEMIPLPPGQKATLEIRPTRRFDIGLGQPGRGAVAEVEGGVLGIIIDARGRPLRLPRDDVQRQERLQQWLSALNVTYATSGHNN